MDNWLRTFTLTPKDRTYRPFSKAPIYVHPLVLKSKKIGCYYSISGKKPQDIPRNPQLVYEDEWT